MVKKPNKVLVVDDSLVINKMLTECIQSDLHLDVVSVFNVTSAIEAISTHPDEFFVAILDLNLPDAPDGQVVQAMVTLDIRPIILTATLSDDLHDEMMSKPIVDYVIKRNLSEMQYVIDLVGRLYENFERNILIVDDSRTQRKLLRSLLERHNYAVFEADCATKGQEYLDSGTVFDLMIVDYNMPDLSGFEFITKVRSDYSRQDLAIIGISAIGSGTVSVQMLKAGANDFFSRPFMHEEFYCRVNQNIDAISSFRKLKDQAFNDYLTGLYNRRYLFETGGRLYDNANRQHLTMCLALIDIDYFKQFNKEHGHHAGDEMLRHMADILRKHFRDGDVIARMSNEEFCVLCLNVDEQSAFALFERLRARIMSTPLTVGAKSLCPTVSIGFTLDLCESFEDMIYLAEQNAYQAKNQGRDKVFG